jgi:serine protease Do
LELSFLYSVKLKNLSGGFLFMRMRNLFSLFAIVVLASVSALAQGTPPAPTTPPSPLVAPAQPSEPMAFSFYFDGSNYLGILPVEINMSNMSQYGLSVARGVGISRVTEGSPADKAGLKKGDVILQFDNEPVTSTRKLFRLIGEAAPEQNVRLTISRNGAEQQVSVKLGQREDASRTLGALTPELRDRLFQPRTPQRVTPPNIPNAPNAPQVFSYSFGNSRRVGITTTQLTKQLADYFGVGDGQGILITSVGENSPASKAGLRAGDVITEVNGEKVENAGDFTRALNRKDDGEVTLTIIRDKSRHTIKVTPERRPSPAFNLSEIQPAISRAIIPQVRMEMPELRALELNLQGLQALPRIENLVIPKINNLVIPRVMSLPRIERLLKTPPEL